MIILSGNNTVTLCQRALMDIVQEHLNANATTSNGYRETEVKRPIRVTNVKAIASDDTFAFSVTTDPATGGAA